MTRHYIDLAPFERPPLSQNDRMHWHQAARIKRDLATIVRARCTVPRVDHIDVWLCWQPRVRRNRDGDNPAPTVKAAVDALVKLCHVVPDDTTEHVTHKPLELLPVDKTGGRLWLVVEDGREG